MGEFKLFLEEMRHQCVEPQPFMEIKSQEPPPPPPRHGPLKEGFEGKAPGGLQTPGKRREKGFQADFPDALPLGYTDYCLPRIPPTVQNGVPHLLTAAAAQLGFEWVQGAHRPPGVGAADVHGHPVCWAFRGTLGGGRKVCARLAPRGLRRHLLSSRTV